MSGNKFYGQYRKQSSVPKPELPVSRPPQASGFREVPREKEAFQYHSPPFSIALGGGLSS